MRPLHTNRWPGGGIARGRSWPSRALLVLLPLGLLAAPGCGTQTAPGGASGDPAEAAPPAQLRTVTVKLENWPRVVRVQGSLVADDQVVVGAKVAGRVKLVPVDIGSPVLQDQSVLATLDMDELDLRVKQSEAQLAQACAKLGLKPTDDASKLKRPEVPSVREAAGLRDQADDLFRRANTLKADGAIAEEDFQQRKAAWEIAKAKYDAALDAVEEQVALIGMRRAERDLSRQTQKDATILAPFTGIVQHRYVAPGAYLQVGQPVVSLMRTDKLRFRGGVPEREAASVREKQRVSIRVEGVPDLLEAEVSRIAPALETSNRSLVVEADVPNPGLRLRASVFAEGDILVDPAAQTLAVPAEAVSEFAGVEKVWVMRGGTAEPRIVETGRRDPKQDRVEILKGLKAGDVVAEDAGRRMRDEG